MPRKVTLIGWPGTGKPLFTMGIAYTLESLGLGHLEPLHPDYGKAMAAAMEGRSVEITPTRTDFISRTRLSSGSDIEIIEKHLTRQDFRYQSESVAEAIGNSHGILFFIKPKFKSEGRKKLRKVIGGRPAVAFQAKSFGPAIASVFKPFKLRRKTKFVMFIMTKTNPKEFSSRYLEKCVSTEIGDPLKYVKKRGASCSFHPIELIYPKKGMNRKGLTYAVKTLLNNAL